MRHPISLFLWVGGEGGEGFLKKFLDLMWLPSNSQNVPQDVPNNT